MFGLLEKVTNEGVQSYSMQHIRCWMHQYVYHCQRDKLLKNSLHISEAI